MLLMLFMVLMYRLLQLLVIRLVCVSNVCVCVWSTRSIAPALIAPVVLNWARQLCSK